ncbi:alpha-taxilin-like [Centroberyx affinis]|uniref:alpha-taxilin-like n=1 Tax=Centroberyx affinis TaxID=166261 RepID=UPI003A5C732A
MEASLKAAEVLAPPQSSCPDGSTEGQAPPPGPSDPMEELSRRLEDVISTYGSAASLLDKQTVVEPEAEKMEEEAADDITVTKETEVSVIMQSLNKLSSPDEKMEALVRKYAEVAALWRGDERKLCALQQKLSGLVREKEQLQAEQRRGIVARSKLEALCRELHTHNNTLKAETLQRCREDEEKRKEISNHFQRTLNDIQAQIEQHNNRNTKLCQENANLADKLESLMNQYELKEQSLEKINKHRDLQQKLAEAKLEQANALLAEAEEKHKREKEYLLREAIDKTKKCFAMKEQELTMKKKLTLYSQKFDEFQATLSKSNDIYVSFKQEMEKMTQKMKKLEKESNVWKTRFESCNKALVDMIEERAEKGKEFELFVVKIQKLELLCRSLQEERKGLYEKIKEVRFSNSSLSSKPAAATDPPAQDESSVPEAAPASSLLTPEEIQELQEIQEEDPVLTEDMARLKAEQARLQEFAASLLAPPADDDEDDDVDAEADGVASALVQFRTKTQVAEKPSKPDPVPQQVEAKQAVEVESMSAEPVLPEAVKVEEVQKPAGSTPAAPTHEEKTQPPSEPLPEQKKVESNQPTDPKPEAAEGKVLSEVSEAQQPKPVAPVQGDRTQQQPSEPVPTPEPKKVETNQAKDPKSEAAEGKALTEVSEAKPVAPAQDKKAPQQPSEPEPAPKQVPTASESATPKTTAPKTTTPSNGDSSKKQASKKKKKNAKKAS